MESVGRFREYALTIISNTGSMIVNSEMLKVSTELLHNIMHTMS